jgi:dipeptidyl aminopeptidase/acylaminoacyl peptidase
MMKVLLVGLGLVLLSMVALAGPERRTEGNRTVEGVPPIGQVASDRIARYSNIRSAGFRSWHPSGNSLLISSRFGDTRQLHTVSQPLGARHQITFFKEPVGGGWFSPVRGQNVLMFTRDSGGDENHQIFRLDLATGDSRQMTVNGSRNSGVSWSNDGRFIAYMSNRDDAKRFDVWVSEADKPETARILVRGTGFYWSPGAWSPDNSSLVVDQTISAVNTRAFVVNVATGDMTRVGPPDEIADYGFADFSRDGTSLYVASDLGMEFSKLRRIDLATGDMETITDEIDWGIANFAMSHDRKRLAFVTNEDGISKLYLLNTRTHAYKRVREIPQGVIGGVTFSPDDRRLSMTLGKANSPADVFVYNLRKRALTRWTQSEVGGLDPDTFVDASLVHYPTWDTVAGKPRMIPAFVYRPHSGAKAQSGQHAVMISIHGGPEGQVRPSFSSRVQALVNELGVVVITPNVRGSAGYGKTYIGLDNGLKREDSVRDIGALLDWINTQPDMDPDRVGVIGGSYGGYMVLAALTHYSDRIKAGVEYVGISNFVTFLRNTSDYRRDHRRQEYGDERKQEVFDYLNRTAPINNVARIKAPLFVLQGANDPRVPASESEQIVEKVRENGKDVWYLLFHDEGHGFRKKANQIYSNAAVMAFLEDYL